MLFYNDSYPCRRKRVSAPSSLFFGQGSRVSGTETNFQTNFLSKIPKPLSLSIHSSNFVNAVNVFQAATGMRSTHAPNQASLFIIRHAFVPEQRTLAII